MNLFEKLSSSFFIIAGPCVIESEKHTLFMAKQLKTITDELGITLIFKSSFDKANRTSISSYRGLGLTEGLKILQKVKEQFGLPILTDVHEPWQCNEVSQVADILQIKRHGQND